MSGQRIITATSYLCGDGDIRFPASNVCALVPFPDGSAGPIAATMLWLMNGEHYLANGTIDEWQARLWPEDNA